MNPDLLHQLRVNGDVPRHVAVIMDGNGRWARERGLPRHAGHKEGMKAVREAVEGCIQAGVEILTLYAFSTENWRRPKTEILALMSILQVYSDKEARALAEQGVEVRVLGELERLDIASRRAVNRMMDITEGGSRLRLNLMVSYGAREEILRAVRHIGEGVRDGRLRPEDIDESVFESVLFTHGMPDPDLLIRTSGEFRISNFLLWQVAYTELHITSVFWPEFTRDNLYEALLDYQRRERRFGGVTT